MFEVIKDSFGEDILVATFGYGGVVMEPTRRYDDGRVALAFRDCCNKMVVGKKIGPHEVPYDGMRAMFIFDNVEGLDVLIKQCNECREMLLERKG